MLRGTRRLRVELRRRGLRALQPKAFSPRTTDSTHELRCTPNRLLDQPKLTQANRVWVSGSTYLPLANGDWACLGTFQDMTRKLVMGASGRASKRTSSKSASGPFLRT